MIKNNYKKISLALAACLLWAGGINGQMDDTLVVDCDLDVNTIAYMEDEETVELDFDSYFYLPENFNPYHGMILELNDIIYLENEEEVILDSRPGILLP